MAGAAVLPFLGSVIGGFQQSANIDKQIAANKAENRDTRLYNLNLAKMQNQWNIEQWSRENAYNSPSAVAARMEAAGLNRDLAYSQGGMFQASASSPELTSGAPATPSRIVTGKQIGRAHV